MSARGATLAVATVLVGLSAGFFFTYQASVTLGLAEVGDIAYVETFQAINDTIRNPAFAIVFFGSIPAMVAALVANRHETRGIRMLIGAALPLYLIGLIVTVTGNVPLNDELAGHEIITPSVAADARAVFEDDWNRLNLIRTVAIGGGFAALVAAGLIGSYRGAEHGSRVTTGHNG